MFETGLERLMEKIALTRALQNYGVPAPAPPPMPVEAASPYSHVAQAAKGPMQTPASVGAQAAEHAMSTPQVPMTPVERGHAAGLQVMQPRAPQPNIASRALRGAKWPLMLGGLAAGGAALYGGLKGLERDRQRDALVYSPMTGVS